MSGDFESLPVKSSDFIYADPPYDVEFTQYAKSYNSLCVLGRLNRRDPSSIASCSGLAHDLSHGGRFCFYVVASTGTAETGLTLQCEPALCKCQCLSRLLPSTLYFALFFS